MSTYKGGIPKLKWGEDLAPDHQPTGMPQFLTSGMAVIGTESKVDRDNLATVIAKRSTDSPASIAEADWAPGEVSPDGRTFRNVYEDRHGNELYRHERTTALGEDTLPTFTTCEQVPKDWSSYDEARAAAREALLEVCGIVYDGPTITYARETVSPSYHCTRRDYLRFAARALNRMVWTLPLDPALRKAERARILAIYLADA